MKLVKILIVLAVLAIGAYSYLWYHQAKNSAKLVTDRLAHLQETASAEGADFAFTYEKTSVGGYPFQTEIHFENPSLRYNARALKKLLLQQPQLAKDIEEKEENLHFSDEWTLDGTLTFSGNYFSRELAVHTKGTLSGHTQANTESLKWQSQWDDTAGCALTLSQEAPLSLFSEDIFALFKDDKNFVKYVRGIQCNTEDLRVINQETQAILLQSEEQGFVFASKDKGNETYEVKFKFDTEDYQIADEFERFTNYLGIFFRSYFQQTALPEAEILEKLISPINSGSNDAHIDVKYEGPALSDFAQNQSAEKIKLDVRKFEIENQLFSISWPFKIETEQNSDTLKFNLTSNGIAKFEPAFREYASQRLQRVLFGTAITGTQNSKIKKDLQMILADPEGFLEMVATAAPKLDELGTIHLDANLSYQAAKNEFGGPADQQMDIKSAGFKSDLYALTAGGYFKNNMQEMDIGIHCKLCDDLIADAYNYLRNIDELSASIDPNSPPSLYTDLLLKKIQAYIQQISLSEDEGKTRVITLKSGPTGEVLLSGKPIVSAMMLWMQYFAPGGMPKLPNFN